jgi:large subunit ribosomal protein L18
LNTFLKSRFKNVYQNFYFFIFTFSCFVNKTQQQNLQRARRHKRVRAKVKGTGDRPRLSVFRSNKGVFLQLIDDDFGKTLISARMISGKGTKTERSARAAEELAKKAREKKITQAVFDRGGYRYHGIVRSVADGARKGGLKF